MSAPVRIHLILPAYNEGDNLVPLFQAFMDLNVGNYYKYYLINDGSTDDTLEVSKKLQSNFDLKVISHEKNKGLSQTLYIGLKSALEEAEDSDVLVFMDSDNTHLPSQVSELICQIQNGADISIASRYQPGATIEGLSDSRKIVSVIASFLFRIFLPVKGVKDFSCGFRAIRASLLRKLSPCDLESIFQLRGFACTTGLLLALTRDPAVVVSEIPMKLKYNQKRGVSKMNLKQTSFESLRLIAKEIATRRQFRNERE
jgi:dolichol-phosphate mannosyltransferase